VSMKVNPESYVAQAETWMEEVNDAILTNSSVTGYDWPLGRLELARVLIQLEQAKQLKSIAISLDRLVLAIRR
jgi:hypothetical protein